MKNSSQLTLLSIVLIVILGFAVYANSLNGEFVWDDRDLVKNNIYIKNFSHTAHIFTKPHKASDGRKDILYRPIQVFSYLVDYSIWKLNVQGYHLTNILVHILVALTLYWLITILFKDRLISLLTGILFVVLPVHTAAIAYISGRADPLSLLFMLLSFILYIKYIDSKKIAFYLPILLSYILALLSKENSLILPILLLLYHFSFKKKLKRKEYLPIAGIAFIYIILRAAVFKTLLKHLSCSTTLWQRLPGFFVAITNYIRMMLFPFGLHMDYGDKLFNFIDPQALMGAAIFGSLLLYAFRKRRSNNLVFFSISWFILTILPVSNLYPIGIAYMAEHWLYVPSIGFCLLLAHFLTSLYKTKNLRVFVNIFAISLLVYYSYWTFKQNTYWKEPVGLYKRILRYTPDSQRAYNNLGSIYFERGNPDQAIPLYKKAIAINPSYAEAYNNLGIAYHEIGKIDQAIPLYKKAIAINPSYAEVYYNLGNSYYEAGKIDQAIPLYKKAIAINQYYSRAHNNLGSAYFNIGKHEEAIALYEKAIAIHPDYAQAYNNLGSAYFEIGRIEEAVDCYKKAIAIEPNYIETYNNLAGTYIDIGRPGEAIDLYHKIIKLDPNYAQAHYNLSLSYFRKKQYKLALEYCDKAKALGFTNPAYLETLKPYRGER